MIELECPDCTHRIDTAEGRAICSNCGKIWPIEKGVLCLGRNDQFPRDFPRREVAELVALAESDGWQVALHDDMRRRNPLIYRKAVDEYRAQWRCLIPTGHGGRALELRCGWGPVSVGLAEDFGLVVAADTSFEMARFTALRSLQAGLENVVAMCFDPGHRWPFPTDYLDVVVLQDILEWSSTRTGVPPIRLLREVGRVLRPDGWLVVHVANRLGPERLSHFFRVGSRGSTSVRRRVGLHTLFGYQHMLIAAGFGNHTCYGTLPSAAEPFYIVPLDMPGAMKFFLTGIFNSRSLQRALKQRHLLAPYRLTQGLWAAARALPVAGLVKHLMPGYAILAAKQRS